MDGEQIGVIGLVAGIGRLPVLLGGEWMNHTGLEARGGRGPLHRLVIAACAFDSHETVMDGVLGECGAHLSDSRVESGTIVLDDGGRNEDVAMNLDRALAQSTQTMPKCSGPTFCTRGWNAPVGFWTDSLALRRDVPDLRDLRVVAMRKTFQVRGY